MSEIKYYMYKNENDYTSTTELAQGFKDLEKDFDGLKYSKCVECGLCSKVCPSKINLLEIIRNIKEDK
jgi:Na+-translocating ferredoxin:NAD+ oxidoreductase RnfC subunit